MRRAPAPAVVVLLLGALVAGCRQSAAPAPAPVASPPVTAPVAGGAPEPLPAGACTPGTTAVELPSSPYGGYALKPPEPGGTADTPWFVHLTADQMEEWEGGGSMLGTLSMRKSGTATVDAGQFWLRGSLLPGPSAAWWAEHLILEGVTPNLKQVGESGPDGMFHFRIPPGKPGDSFRLTLKDVLLDDGTTGHVAVTFCRQTPPRVAVTYKGAPLPPALPVEAPLTLRLTFTAEMLRETVERALTGPHGKEDRRDGDWITDLKWLDDRTLELTAGQVPPVMQFNLAGAQDVHGLFLVGGVPRLFAGDPPRVLAVDPATGKESRLADLQPEPDAAVLAPDGKSLRLVSRQFAPGWGSSKWQTKLVDLTTGKVQEINPQELWLPAHGVDVRYEGKDSLLVTRGAQETVLTGFTAGVDSFLLSPDGQWIAVLERSGAYSPESYQPVRFLIVSADGKTRKALTGEARMWRPGKDGLMLYGPVWSPDSTRIAFTQPGSAKGTAMLVVADVAAGALKTVAADLAGAQAYLDPVSWSPDGRSIQAGPLLVDAATGKVERTVDGIGMMPFWSADGQWLLFQREEWGEVTAVNLRTGERKSLGQGKALGWRPDGTAVLIRWPGSVNRTIWGI
ncbi:MAG TPA: hypothetical protein VNT01_10325 [Symbiobacteriaceae bacterium]|nr:hypothetical protein [Symbiobacteriaceae bacterium]